MKVGPAICSLIICGAGMQRCRYFFKFKDTCCNSKKQKLGFSDPQILWVLFHPFHSQYPRYLCFMTMGHQQYLSFSWTTLNGKNCQCPIAVMEFGHTLEKYYI